MFQFALSGQGSSPRSRGALGGPALRGRMDGIIPAFAGSTRRSRPCRRTRRDHPRVRGEHLGRKPVFCILLGSSPRSRGARHKSFRSQGKEGIIPAFAGSTTRRYSEPSANRDHPRVRGEHGGGVRNDDVTEGSSPRSRGALEADDLPVLGTGIIPAFAGSTLHFDQSRGRRWDHPRVRGEHPASTMLTASVRGSSPRSRGALGLRCRQRVRHGIIPAFAGSTVLMPRPSARRGDHPRVRGEHDAVERH